MAITTAYRVNFYDTDAMAVVHHSNYIRWFEIGRVEYLRSIGITLEEMMEDGYVFPIVEVYAKYHSPARFDDELIIETTAKDLTKVKMVFDYKIFNKRDRKLLVTGRTQNVFTSRETGQITRLPAKYYEKLGAAKEQQTEEAN